MTVTGSGASAGYLFGEVAGGRENYYTGAAATGEPAGRWSGALAERLGLVGDVEADDMLDLYSSYVGPDGTKLGQAPKAYTESIEASVTAWVDAHPGALPEDVERARRAIERAAPGALQGWDLTSSVTKTVSAAHASVWRREVAAERGEDEATRLLARSTRLAIERVIERANEAMLERASELTHTRAGAHGRAGTAGRWVRTTELAVASFFQHTSRAGDPQLHWHNAILNKARDAEGEYRALDTVDLNAHLHELAAVFDREVAEGMAGLGVSMVMRDTGAERPSWEVAAVDQGTADLFSSRRKAIVRDLGPALALAEARKGGELSDVELKRLRQEITLASRPGKSHVAESFETMIDRWHDKLVQDAATGLDPLGDAIIAQVQAGPAAAASPVWSARDVTERAIAALGEKRATWRRADLFGEIEQRVPLLGSRLSTADRAELLDRLTDKALADAGQVAQVAGFDGVPVPAELARLYKRPSAVRFATRGALLGEEAIRRAAGVRGMHHVPEAASRSWLAKNRPSIGADQREAAVGIVTSDAAVCRLIGPPGAGKSYTVATVRDLWGELSGGGRVHGVTVAQVAADVLASEGVDVSANVAKFLQVQDRLAAGKGREADMRYVIDRKDLVVLDEASMIDREQIRRVHEAVVERAGARLVLAGDPAQLGSIGAGGVLPLLDGYADTFTLSEIRRMGAAWERRASVLLRQRDEAALDEYDRHGRIVDCATTAEAEEAAAAAYVAETLAGKSVVVTATTEHQAASISAATRARLVELGLVEAEGVGLASGLLAGVGDVVMCRDNVHRLGLTNRALYRVEEVEAAGSLRATNLSTGERVVMPAPYVESSVDSGYAATVHATEGLSVDTAYTVTDGGMDARSLLVSLTRGREVNKVFVALGREERLPGETPARAAETYRDQDGAATRERAVELAKDRRQETGRAVLARCLAKGDELDAAATVAAERDAAYLASASTVLGRYADVVYEGCRRRLEGDLDRLVVEGELGEDVRARLHGEDETETLSRALRAVEQNGEDSFGVLREVVTSAGFAKANTVSSVLVGRIKVGRDLTAAAAVQGDELPARMPAGYETSLVALQGVREDRRAELGTQVAAEPPAWAVQAFGPVPDEPLARLGWERRAGEVAWYREAVNHTDEARALPSGPGISETEHRGAWCGAYTALGRPEAEASEAAMTDGQLRLRIEAWRRQEELAPAFADDAMKATNLAAEEARHAAAEAGEDEAGAWLAEAAARRETATAVEEVGEVRDAWYAETAAQREGADRAQAELVKVRGRQVDDQAEDAMTGEDWLAAERAATVAEDPHRSIGEQDALDQERQAVVEAKLDAAVAADAGVDEPVVVPAQKGASEDRLPAQPSASEVEAAARRAVQVSEMLADRASAEQAQARAEELVYEEDLRPEDDRHEDGDRDSVRLVAERR